MIDRPAPQQRTVSSAPQQEPGEGSGTAASSAGLVDLLRTEAARYIARREAELADTVADLARALRGSSAEPDGRASVKTVLDGVAENLEALSGVVREHGLRELRQRMEAATRARPVTATLLAVATGYGLFHLTRTTGPALHPDTGSAAQRRAV